MSVNVRPGYGIQFLQIELFENLENGVLVEEFELEEYVPNEETIVPSIKRAADERPDDGCGGHQNGRA
jgi:hypothetical protein